MADTETAVRPAPVTYDQFWAAREELDASGKAELNILVGQAQAYVWGWEDATGQRTPDEPWNFGHAYGLYAAEFLAGKRSHRSPVAQCYPHWKATGHLYPEDGYSWKS